MHPLFGIKIYDHKKQQVGIIVNAYNLGYVDAPDAQGVKVLSPEGKIYPTNLDNLTAIEGIESTKGLNIPEGFLS